MASERICIATITWARTPEEEQLLREALSQLASLGLKVYLTDGGSSGGFLQFIAGIPHFTLLQAATKGVWAQARSSLQAAFQSGTEYILYTEPDKLLFFRNHLPAMLSHLPSGTGILLAARSEAGMATFPAFQRMTETTINNCCAEVTGKPADYTYGPFVMHRELVPYLQQVTEDIGWGWRPYTFGIAHRLNYVIEAHIRDFACPPDQQADTPAERIYRMRQLQQNIQGLVLSTAADLRKPGS